MTSPENPELKVFADSWQRALNAEDWDGAIMAGISAYLYFGSKGAVQYKHGALGLIAVALEMQDRKEGHRDDKLRCSFCGKDASQVRLGGGASAHICEECVRMFGDIFSRKGGPTR